MNIMTDVRVDGLGTTHIDVVVFSENGLQKYLYKFIYKKHSLVPKAFVSYDRKTKRHAFRNVDTFGSADKRYDSLNEMPKVPDAVREKAHEGFFETLEW